MATEIGEGKPANILPVYKNDVFLGELIKVSPANWRALRDEDGAFGYFKLRRDAVKFLEA